MANLIRAVGVFVALALVSQAASADPVTAGLIIGFIGTYGAAIATVISLAVSVYGSAQAKKKASQAASDARAKALAGLQDRMQTVLSAASPWQIIYGEPAPLGGAVIAIVTSGSVDQFKHVIYAFAAHECESIDELYIDGMALGIPGDGGSATLAEYQLTKGIPTLISVPFELVEEDSPDSDSGSGGPTGRGVCVVRTPQGDPLTTKDVAAIIDANSNDLSGSVQQGYSPGVLYDGRLIILVGPVGTTGYVKVWVDRGGSAVSVQKHLSPGGVDTADANLMAAAPTKWTAAHKLSGFTYIVMTLDMRCERLQGGVPNVTAKIKGKKVLDPRTGRVAYSRNPALCLADFIASEAGYLASYEQIELNSLIAAANDCDVATYDPATANADRKTYGGTPRYTCDGAFKTEADRDGTRQQFEDAMAGFSLESGGVWRILAGAWSTPVMALGDADMLSPVVVSQTCHTGAERYNGARGSYINMSGTGISEDFVPYSNAALLALDGKAKLLDLPMTFTGAAARAQQLSRVRVEQSRGGFLLAINPSMSAWHLQPGDRITLTNAVYGFTNKAFRVQEWTYSAASPLALQIIGDEEAFYDTADATADDASPNTNFPSPFIKPDPPFDLEVLSGPTQMIQQGATLIVRVKVQWADRAPSTVKLGGGVRVNYRLMDPVSDWLSVALAGDATSVYLLGLTVGGLYQIRVRYETMFVPSDWVEAEHVVIGRVGDPSGVGGRTLVMTDSGLVATWHEPTNWDLIEWAGTELRRGGSWDTGVVLFKGRVTTKNLGWQPAGIVTIWSANANVLGAYSVPVSDSITIAAPAQPLVTVQRQYSAVRLLWQDCKTMQPVANYQVREGNDFASATALGLVTATQFDLTAPTAGMHRYWVCAVDVASNASAASFVDVEVLPSIEEAMAALHSGLDAVVGDLKDETGAVAAQLAAAQAQATATAQQLANEVTNRAADVSGLRSESEAALAAVNAQLADLHSVSAYDASRTYEDGDFVKFNGKLYSATNETSGNDPTDTAHWSLVGAYGSLGEAVTGQGVQLASQATRITTAENNLTVETTARNTLAAQVRGSYDGTDPDQLSEGLAFNEKTARATGDSANALLIAGVDSRLTLAEGSVVVQAKAINSLQTSVTNQGGVLTSQGAAITSIQSFVGARPNLLPNGGFERGGIGWFGHDANWIYSLDANWGTRAVHFNCSGTGLTMSDYFPVGQGSSYTVSGDSLLVGATGGSVYFDLQLYDSAGALVLDGPQVVVSTNHDFLDGYDARQRHAVQVLVPSGAVTARARFVYEDITGSNVLIGCRLVKVERGDLPATAYTSEAGQWAESNATQALTTRTTGVEGALTTQAGAIISLTSRVENAEGVAAGQATAITSLNTSVSDIKGDLSSQSSQITSLANRVTDEEGVNTGQAAALAGLRTDVDYHGGVITSQANALTTLQSFAGTRTNLLPNGSFENGNVGWTGSDANWGYGSRGNWGNSAWHYNCAGTGLIVSDLFSAGDGVSYTVSGDSILVNATGGSVYFDLMFYDAQGSVTYGGRLAISTIHDFEDGYAARQRHAVATFPPAGTTGIRARFVYEAITGSGVLAACRQIKVERGDLPATAYTSEAGHVAEATAAQALGTRTTAAEGSITSQSYQLTSLNNRLTAADGVSAGQASSISSLNSSVRDIGGNLSAQADSINRLNTSVGNNSASITQTSSALATLTAGVKATWRLNLDVNGNVAGLILDNNGTTSNAVFRVDRFAIATAGSGGTIKYPFVVGSVAGVSTVGIDGNMVVDGSILARHIQVSSLAAITGNIGQLTITSSGGGDWGYLRSPNKWLDNTDGFILARHPNGDSFVDFKMGAGHFYMHAADGSAGLSFPGIELTNGGLTINQANVIGTLQLQGNSVTVPVTSNAAAQITGNNNWQDVLDCYVNLPVAAKLFVSFSAGQGFPSGARQFGLALAVDGVEWYSTGVIGPAIQPLLSASISNSVGAGNHRVLMRWWGDSSMVLGSRSIFTMGAMR